MFKIFLSRNGSEPTDVTDLLSLWGCDTGSEVKIISRVGSFRNLTGQMIKTRTGSPFIIPGLTNENPLKPGLTPAWRSGDVPVLLWTSARARVCVTKSRHTPHYHANVMVEEQRWLYSMSRCWSKTPFTSLPLLKLPGQLHCFTFSLHFLPSPSISAQKNEKYQIGAQPAQNHKVAAPCLTMTFIYNCTLERWSRRARRKDLKIRKEKICFYSETGTF